MKRLILAINCILLLSSISVLYSQTIPVGTAGLEESFRRAQLLGETDSSVSFTVKPVYPTISLHAREPYYYNDESRFSYFNNTLNLRTGIKNLNIGLTPFSIQSQINTHHPYGWNDGAMIPSKGGQILISGGAYLNYGPLSVQIQPEIVLAGNSKFETFNQETYPVIVARYYDFYNNIDLPVRFGTAAYSKISWGQSSVRLNYKSLSAGLSTENLWWGPGLRNALIMSNTAQGFKHFTINTRKPINTPIGSFEGQVIAGKLENSSYGVLEPEWNFFGNPNYIEKANDWRYISGFVMTWHPKWVQGLFFGLSQSSQLYHNDLSKLGDYLPFFSSSNKLGVDNSPEKRDNRGSIFMRWIWAEENAEIYFEFGKNNNVGNSRNNALDPARRRAYVFGMRKMLPFNHFRKENILVSIEATQLQQTSTSDILDANSWYINKYVRQGYTNKGEILGAGIGPGANAQTLDISWVKGFKRLGIQFERYIHNNDFYYYAYDTDNDARRHWTDLSASLSGEWNYKNLLFNTKLMAIKSLNYQWYLYQGPNDDVNVSGKDAVNFQIQAGISYRF
jgi:hypothetical protein